VTDMHLLFMSVVKCVQQVAVFVLLLVCVFLILMHCNCHGHELLIVAIVVSSCVIFTSISQVSYHLQYTAYGNETGFPK